MSSTQVAEMWADPEMASWLERLMPGASRARKGWAAEVSESPQAARRVAAGRAMAAARSALGRRVERARAPRPARLAWLVIVGRSTASHLWLLPMARPA